METVYTAMSPAKLKDDCHIISSSSSDPNTFDSFLESMSGNEAASGVDGDNFQHILLIIGLKGTNILGERKIR